MSASKDKLIEFTTKVMSKWHKLYDTPIVVWAETRELAAENRFSSIWDESYMSVSQFETLKLDVDGGTFTPCVHVVGVHEVKE